MWRNGVLAACVIAAGGLAVLADPPAKKPTKDEVKEQMIKVHRGDKAPLARVKSELGKETPDWEQLAKDAKLFAEMGETLKGGGASPYTSPEKYVASSVALGKAVGDKDKAKASEAFTGLTKSCSSCHYGVPK